MSNKHVNNPAPLTLPATSIEVGYSKAVIAYGIGNDADLTKVAFWVKDKTADSAEVLTVEDYDVNNRVFQVTDLAPENLYGVQGAFVDEFLAGTPQLLSSKNPELINLVSFTDFTTKTPVSISEVTVTASDLGQIGSPPNLAVISLQGEATEAVVQLLTIAGLTGDDASAYDWSSATNIYRGKVEDGDSITISTPTEPFVLRVISAYNFANAEADVSQPSYFGTVSDPVEGSGETPAPSTPTDLLLTPIKVGGSTTTYNMLVSWAWLAKQGTGAKRNALVSYRVVGSDKWVSGTSLDEDYLFVGVPYRTALEVKVTIKGWNENESNTATKRVFISEDSSDSGVPFYKAPVNGNSIPANTNVQLLASGLYGFKDWDGTTGTVTFKIDADNGDVAIGETDPDTGTAPLTFDATNNVLSIKGSAIVDSIVSADYVMGWLGGNTPTFRTANRSSTGFNESSAGIWMGYSDANTFQMSLGNGSEYIKWDGTSLTISGQVKIGDSNITLGQKQKYLQVYKRASSTPAVPSGGTYANPIPDGWSATIPDYDGQACYVSFRTLTSDGEEPQDQFWAAPSVISENITPARIVSLVADSQVIKFDSAGTADREQVVITANTQNIDSPTFQWSTTSGTGTASANVYTVPRSAFALKDSLTVTVTVSTPDGDVTDSITIIRVQDGNEGTSSLNGYLTNEAHVVSAYANGTVQNFEGANGVAKLFYGETDVSAGTSFSLIEVSSGLNIAINSSTGAYSVSSLSSDSASATIVMSHPTHGDFSKTFSISKSKSGTAGSDGQDGQSAYIHIAYANNATGTSGFNTVGGTYMGQYSSSNPAASTDPADYTWTKIQGPQGEQGTQGPKGSDGQTTYFHVAYANNSTGSSGFNQSSGAYIGTYVDTNPADSTDYRDYNWVKIEGAQGPDGTQGIPGTNGSNGKTSYLHIAYANNSTGSSGFNQTSGTYIGQYVDFVSQDSTDPSDYTWTKIKGETGATGPQGNQGTRGPKGADGLTTYFHVAYANNSTGSSGFNQTSGSYMGTYVDNTAADSTDRTKYTWVKIEGAQGPDGTQGIPGTNGSNGKTSYLHIAYANNSTGSSGFNQTSGTYIGQYVDFVSQDSTDPRDYTWTKIKGDKGDKGNTGNTGAQGNRGAGTFTVGYSGTWPASFNNTLAAVAAGAVTDDVPVINDVVTVYSLTNPINRYVVRYSGGSKNSSASWSDFELIIHGDALIEGTVVADTLVAGSLIEAPDIRGGRLEISGGNSTVILDSANAESPISITDSTGTTILGWDNEVFRFRGRLGTGKIDNMSVFSQAVQDIIAPPIQNTLGGTFSGEDDFVNNVNDTAVSSIPVFECNDNDVIVSGTVSLFGESVERTSIYAELKVFRSLNGGAWVLIDTQTVLGYPTGERGFNEYHATQEFAIEDTSHGAAFEGDTLAYKAEAKHTSGAVTSISVRIRDFATAQQRTGGSVDGNATSATFPYVGLDLSGSSAYPRMFPNNNPGTSSVWLRAPATSGGFLPYSNGSSNLGTSSWKWASIHGVNIFENGTKLSDKYLGKTATAVNSDKLGGLDSTSFARLGTTAPAVNYLYTRRADAANAALYVNNYSGGIIAEFMNGASSTSTSSTTGVTINGNGTITQKSAGKQLTMGHLNSSWFHINTDATSGIYFYDHVETQTFNTRGSIKEGGVSLASKYLGKTAKAVDADKLDGLHASAFASASHSHTPESIGAAKFVNNAYLNSSTTTATFITELTNKFGCFNNSQVTLKCAWSYAGNSDLDTGHPTIGTIELAGCTIETWGGTYKHVRITRPNTGTGGHGVYEYNDQSSSYAPGWREIWTSESDGSGSGLDADLLDGLHASSFARTSGTYPGLRAQATTKDDVGLGNVPNWSSGTFDGRYLGKSANAVSASKWATARSHTVTLTGDVTGSATQSVDGTGNKSWILNTVVGDDSHVHHRLDSTYDLDVKPNTSGIGSGVQAIKAFFTSLGGMTGSANTDYQDLLVLDTYSDTSGGNANAITMDKSDGSMRIWNVGQNASSWGSAQRVFADNYHPNADKWTIARTITLAGDASGSVSIDGTANKTLTVSVANDSHTHDGRYYTEAESNARFLGKTAKAADSDKLDGLHSTSFNSVVARYINTSSASTRLKIRLPFTTKSAKMLKFTVSLYAGYGMDTYEVSGYLYPSTNQWYSPKVIYSGTTSADIRMGRDTDGRAYVSIGGRSYAGCIVHSVTVGYSGSAADSVNTGWSITRDDACPNMASVPVYNTWHSGNDSVLGRKDLYNNWTADNNFNGAIRTNGHTLVNGTDTWIRTKGSHGILFGSHGGGWNMQDSTWIRSYGGKAVHVSSTRSLDALYAVGGVRTNTRFFDNNATGEGGLVGNYTERSYADKMIWTIGTKWMTHATHYGLGYHYGSANIGTQHQIVVKENGTTNIRLGMLGDIWAARSVNAPVLKENSINISDKYLNINQLSYNSPDSWAAAFTAVDQFREWVTSGDSDTSGYSTITDSIATGFINSIIGQFNTVIADRANIGTLSARSIEATGRQKLINNTSSSGHVDGWFSAGSDYTSLRTRNYLDDSKVSNLLPIDGKNVQTIRLNNTGNVAYGHDPIEVDHNAIYEISVMVYAGGATQAGTRYIGILASGEGEVGDNLGSQGVQSYTPEGTRASDTSNFYGYASSEWEVRRYVKFYVVGANVSMDEVPLTYRQTAKLYPDTRYLTIRALNWNNSSTETIMHLYNPSVREINTGIIVADNISARAITSTKIATNSINAGHIVANTITASEIAANAITASELAANSVNAGHIVANSITASEIAANAINASELNANSVNASHIVANSITANEIAANAINASELNANSVNATHIVAGTITANELAAGSVTSNQIVANSITTVELAAQAVHAENIKVGTITSNHIATGSIVAEDIKTNSLTSVQIAADAITASELKANSVTSAHIVAGTIQASDIQANTITAAQIAADAITASELAANSVNAGHIVANSITASEIDVGSINIEQLSWARGNFGNSVMDIDGTTYGTYFSLTSPPSGSWNNNSAMNISSSGANDVGLAIQHTYNPTGATSSGMGLYVKSSANRAILATSGKNTAVEAFGGSGNIPAVLVSSNSAEGVGLEVQLGESKLGFTEIRAKTLNTALTVYPLNTAYYAIKSYGDVGVYSGRNLSLFTNNGVSRQRFDSRDSGNEAILHMYGVNSNGSNTAARLAMYGGSAYSYIEGQNASIRLRTAYGYVNIGPVNSSWCHFQTDRAGFHFNRKVAVSGDVTFFYSDERLKTVTGNLNTKEALANLRTWKPVRYVGNHLAKSNGFDEEGEHIGLLAQDVEKHYPELTPLAPFDQEDGISKSGENYKTLKYERTVAVLVAALQEEATQRENLENKVERLEALVNKLLQEK